MAKEYSNDKVFTPYNFVSFANTVAVRYDSPDQLPRHDRRYDALLSGSITYRLTAKTPVFISDGNSKTPDFYRTAGGRYAIPGSSVRGLIRQTMQILSSGLIRPDEDMEIESKSFFRRVASPNTNEGQTLDRVLVESYKKRVKTDMIKGEINANGKQKITTVPKNIKAGYLVAEPDEGGRMQYAIYPTQNKRYFRVPRDSKAIAELGALGSALRPCWYRFSGNYQQADKLRETDVTLTQPEPNQGFVKGTMIFTGKPVGNKPNMRYVFPLPDWTQKAVGILPEDVIAYQEDLEIRSNSLRGGGYDIHFWELPSSGCENAKPVFYLEDGGHIYWGMSEFIRIGSKHSFWEGVHQTYAQQEQPVLDYTYAMLGYTTKQGSYRSRVQFGDLYATGKPEPMKAFQAVLSAPKPSFFQAYVQMGKNKDTDRSEVKTYEDDGFALRGYKLYWGKEFKLPPVPEKQNVASTLAPLPEGTVFQGQIRFDNLHPDELGLLLWCLQLDPEQQCFHTIGMGKPLGLGRVMPKIEELRLDSLSAYSPEGLCLGSALVDNQRETIQRYIEEYWQKATQLSNPPTTKKKKPQPFQKRKDIADFLYLRSTLRQPNEVRYMTLEEYKGLEYTLPTVYELRNSKKES